jgi:hypothetical protein
MGVLPLSAATQRVVDLALRESSSGELDKILPKRIHSDPERAVCGATTRMLMANSRKLPLGVTTAGVAKRVG